MMVVVDMVVLGDMVVVGNLVVDMVADVVVNILLYMMRCKQGWQISAA
jgi:hypothetical protein